MLGAAAVALTISSGAFGQSCTTCAPAPVTHPCPPKFWHWAEGPPKLKFKKACPKPVCDPCTLPHAGYYQTCWHPWPWDPDWSHCVLPPTALTYGEAPGDVVIPLPSPRAPAALPPPSESTLPSNPTNQGAQTPAQPRPVQQQIEARLSNR
jgi:hypothetical protein